MSVPSPQVNVRSGWRLFLPIGAYLLAISACGPAPLKEAASACATDGECAAGLLCLGIGSVSDAGCIAVIKACSRPCAQDSDCAPLGGAFRCFDACNGTSSCGATR